MQHACVTVYVLESEQQRQQQRRQQDPTRHKENSAPLLISSEFCDLFGLGKVCVTDSTLLKNEDWWRWFSRTDRKYKMRCDAKLIIVISEVSKPCFAYGVLLRRWLVYLTERCVCVHVLEAEQPTKGREGRKEGIGG